MPDIYTFNLSEGITLEVNDERGPINTWRATRARDKLIVTSGNVSVTGEGMLLKSATAGYQTVVTLHGASWDSSAGNSGDATIHLGQGTPGSQGWSLESVD